MDWMESYISLMDDESSGIEEVIELINKNKPQKLYRYRGYGKNWVDELIDAKIYMANPKMFNDPFDCSLNVDFDKHINGLKSKIFSDVLIDSKLDKAYDNLYGVANSIYQSLREKYRIACFAQSNRSILMWSHYAASHTGYCIEYDVQNLYKVTDLIFPVIYTNKRHDDTNHMLGKSKKGFNYLLRKSIEWSYEREWRMIGIAELLKENYIEVPGTITAIYLGCNSDSRNETKFIKRFAKICDIPLYKMKPSKKQYRLIKERIPT